MTTQNELIELIGQKNGKCYGILKTVCFPNQYYGGIIYYAGMCGWMNENTDIKNFYETDVEAYLNTMQSFERK